MPCAGRPRSSRSTPLSLATLAACPTPSSSRRLGSSRARPFPAGTNASSRWAGRRCRTSSSSARARAETTWRRRTSGMPTWATWPRSSSTRARRRVRRCSSRTWRRHSTRSPPRGASRPSATSCAISARAFGRDREAVGRAHMLTGDIGETALRARHDTLAEPTLAHFLPIGMMLATPVLDLAEIGERFPPPYVVEDKYDGVRAQVHKAGDRVELYSRTFDRVTDRFPELLEPLRAIEVSFVLDAEVLA